MKVGKLKKDRVNIITLGCSKNMVDSEVLSGQLKANDIEVVHENRKLDHNIVVVNTCGFIDKAKEESINTILDQVELKRRGILDKVFVILTSTKSPGTNFFEDCTTTSLSTSTESNSVRPR